LRDSDLIVRKLRPVPFALVASPRYWRERGKPRHPNDLSLHETLIFTTGNTARSGRNLWIFQDRNGEDIEVPVRGMIDANDGRALRKFALNGTGIAYAPRLLVQSHLDTGDLETALDDFMPQDIWVMLAYAQRRHNSAALRTLVQYLEQNFRIPS
jgi:DNA-binding transcriptional LysR family regulator